MAKKNTKRGFTLVELIVVLVILAVLAALLIPALTGYIDKARKSQVVAETRMLTQAVQTEMSTLYASDEYATQSNAGTQTFTAAAKDGKPVGEHEQKLTSLEDRYNAIEVVARKLKVRPNTISKARRKIARELRKKLV